MFEIQLFIITSDFKLLLLKNIIAEYYVIILIKPRKKTNSDYLLMVVFSALVRCNDIVTPFHFTTVQNIHSACGTYFSRGLLSEEQVF